MSLEPKKKQDVIGGRDCEYCHFCGDLIQSHLYERGYGGGSYDWLTHKPFSDRQFKFPEGSFTLKICCDCEDKPSSELIYKARIKAVEDEINKAERAIEDRSKGITRLEIEISKLDEIAYNLKCYMSNLKKDKNHKGVWGELKIPHDLI